MSQESTVNELYFTGPGDPRHKCVAIGFHNSVPVVYKFETVDLPQGTRTTVTFNEQTVVAYLDWALGVHLGAVLRDGSERTPMAEFVERGSSNTARSFSMDTTGKEAFEWRRLGSKQPYAYELISMTAENNSARIATYDPTPREVPKMGRAYAYLRYTFQEEQLLRALCLNRWIDWRGM